MLGTKTQPVFNRQVSGGRLRWFQWHNAETKWADRLKNYAEFVSLVAPGELRTPAGGSSSPSDEDHSSSSTTSPSVSPATSTSGVGSRGETEFFRAWWRNSPKYDNFNRMRLKWRVGFIDNLRSIDFCTRRKTDAVWYNPHTNYNHLTSPSGRRVGDELCDPTGSLVGDEPCDPSTTSSRTIRAPKALELKKTRLADLSRYSLLRLRAAIPEKERTGRFLNFGIGVCQDRDPLFPFFHHSLVEEEKKLIQQPPLHGYGFERREAWELLQSFGRKIANAGVRQTPNATAVDGGPPRGLGLKPDVARIGLFSCADYGNATTVVYETLSPANVVDVLEKNVPWFFSNTTSTSVPTGGENDPTAASVGAPEKTVIEWLILDIDSFDYQLLKEVLLSNKIEVLFFVLEIATIDVARAQNFCSTIEVQRDLGSSSHLHASFHVTLRRISDASLAHL